MKELEIEKKMMEIVNDNKVIISEAQERVEEFVNDILGEEFKVYYFCPTSFDVCLTRKGNQVFGCGFSIRINDNWHYDDNRKFVRDPKVEVNIGTCGSFPIGVDDNQEKKYMAFARFISMASECLLDKFLLMTYEKVEKNYEEYRKLDEELTGAK